MNANIENVAKELGINLDELIEARSEEYVFFDEKLHTYSPKDYSLIAINHFVYHPQVTFKDMQSCLLAMAVVIRVLELRAQTMNSDADAHVEDFLKKRVVRHTHKKTRK